MLRIVLPNVVRVGCPEKVVPLILLKIKFD